MKAERATLILEAQAKGFRVFESDEAGLGWLIAVPAKPRVPAHEQGSFKNSDRAWSAACLIARDYPEVSR
jgi:hypothetical protein